MSWYHLTAQIRDFFMFHPVVPVQLKLIKIENYSQTQQFYYYNKIV
jgi:hypothetical protein